MQLDIQPGVNFVAAAAPAVQNNALMATANIVNLSIDQTGPQAPKQTYG